MLHWQYNLVVCHYSELPVKFRYEEYDIPDSNSMHATETTS